MNNTAPEESLPPTADAARDLMWALLGTAHNVEDRLERAFGEVGLSSPKFTVLSHLVAAGEPLALSEIAARLACVRSNVTQLVDRLEAEGLVRRVASPDDRRSILAELTPLGRERQTAGAAKAAMVHDAFAKAMGGIDIASLEKALDALK
jgi:DNA-binding MarR family transcriptional regulator